MHATELRRQSDLAPEVLTRVFELGVQEEWKCDDDDYDEVCTEVGYKIKDCSSLVVLLKVSSTCKTWRRASQSPQVLALLPALHRITALPCGEEILFSSFFAQSPGLKDGTVGLEYAPKRPVPEILQRMEVLGISELSWKPYRPPQEEWEDSDQSESTHELLPLLSLTQLGNLRQLSWLTSLIVCHPDADEEFVSSADQIVLSDFHPERDGDWPALRKLTVSINGFRLHRPHLGVKFPVLTELVVSGCAASAFCLRDILPLCPRLELFHWFQDGYHLFANDLPYALMSILTNFATRHDHRLAFVFINRRRVVASAKDERETPTWARLFALDDWQENFLVESGRIHAPATGLRCIWPQTTTISPTIPAQIGPVAT